MDASSAAGGLTVGVDGTGTLTKSGNGNVNIAGHLVVAQNADSQGTITLNDSTLGTPGFGNPLGMTSATIGLGGTASLAATNHSLVNLAGPFVVGQNAGSHGTVTVDNSTLGTPGFGGPEMTSATIGGAGTGSLAVTDGSRANLVGPFTVGQMAGSQGTVVVDGAHSVLGVPGFGSGPFGPTAIGAGGNGSVSITNGGTFLLAGAFTIGQNAGSQGSISVSGAGSQITPPGFGSETPDLVYARRERQWIALDYQWRTRQHPRPCRDWPERRLARLTGRRRDRVQIASTCGLRRRHVGECRWCRHFECHQRRPGLVRCHHRLRERPG